VELEIVQALRAANVRVWLLDRPFDLLCGYAQRLVLLEVKTEKRGLTAHQANEIADCWRAGLAVYVVRTPIEALQAVGAIH
jgi:hypothetical protein